MEYSEQIGCIKAREIHCLKKEIRMNKHKNVEKSKDYSLKVFEGQADGVEQCVGGSYR